ncbi:MAG: lytic murein transglycosylase, partial [Erythrobacter sp.]|nr:lytic murein transglycosylase [Erythrobacter sp.]
MNFNIVHSAAVRACAVISTAALLACGSPSTAQREIVQPLPGAEAQAAQTQGFQ